MTYSKYSNFPTGSSSLKEAETKTSEPSVRSDGRQGFACFSAGHVWMIDMTGVTNSALQKCAWHIEL